MRKDQSSSLLLSLADQMERPVDQVEKQPHKEGHPPGTRMMQGVNKAVGHIIQQVEWMSNEVPTVPPQVPAQIDAEAAHEQ